MQLNYIPMHWNKDTKRWDKRCVEMMHELFDFNYDNSLEICHPNAVFKTKPITKEKKDIDEIDWEDTHDSFDDVKYIGYSGYSICVRGDYSGFEFIHSTFRNQMFVDGNMHKRLKTEHPRFLVVYEISSMKVRAIFRATKDTFEVAFNPAFVEKCRDKSIFETEETKTI